MTATKTRRNQKPRAKFMIFGNWPRNRSRSIYQYSNMAPRLSGQYRKFFLSFFCLSIPKIDLDAKKTRLNIECCPERLGAMLEY